VSAASNTTLGLKNSATIDNVVAGHETLAFQRLILTGRINQPGSETASRHFSRLKIIIHWLMYDLSGASMVA